MKRLFLYVIAALLAVQGAWAAAPARYELKLRSGQKMRIDVCSDRIFRVRVTPADTFAESLLERYGLLKTDWEPVQVTQRNEGGVVVLGTPACRIRIDRKDGRISVTDLKGNAILREASYLAPGAPLHHGARAVAQREVPEAAPRRGDYRRYDQKRGSAAADRSGRYEPQQHPELYPGR